VDAAGNSNKAISYSYLDKDPYQGISYYRLKQTDFNGSYTYSQMRAVEYKGMSDISFNIVPNPSGAGGFNVILSGSSAETYNVMITDISGKIVYNKDIVAETKLKINEDLVPGIYTVLVQSTTLQTPVSTKKLVITE
jgi:hypothetical protein